MDSLWYMKRFKCDSKIFNISNGKMGLPSSKKVRGTTGIWEQAGNGELGLNMWTLNAY